MKPLIFLDIDGVLVFTTSPQIENLSRNKAQWLALDKEAVNRLVYLINETDAEVVISSTWRLLYGLGGMRETLAHASEGRIDPARVIGVTPKFGEDTVFHYVPRRDEIQSWLDAHPERMNNFVILDDESDAGIDGHFVQCSWGRGFAPHCLEEALAILKKEQP